MTRYLIEAILQVGLLVPVAVFLVKAKTGDNFLRIFFFALSYVFYQLALVLPKLSASLDLLGGNWNWDGKAFGILCGALGYFVFRKYFSEHDFFTIRPAKGNLKISLAVMLGSALFVMLLAFFAERSEFNVETLVFQLTMPGIDEEIMFRGLLLGLLMTALREKISFFGNPALLLTAVLFGFIHALTLGKDYALDFDPVYFLHTALGGYLFGWLTIRHRSILPAVVAHGLNNFLFALVTMLK
jgi:uncharacterized protein